MKIHNTTVSGSELSNVQKSQEARKEKAEQRGLGRSGEVNSSARTEISERAREMSMAKEAAKGAPDVREDLIADLKARIAAKQYEVDADAIADRMVDEHMGAAGGLS